MRLSSRIRALERAAGVRAAPADCPVCHGRGGGRVRVFLLAPPGAPTSPGPFPEGCPACGRVAESRLTIFLRPDFERGGGAPGAASRSRAAP